MITMYNKAKYDSVTSDNVWASVMPDQLHIVPSLERADRQLGPASRPDFHIVLCVLDSGW